MRDLRDPYAPPRSAPAKPRPRRPDDVPVRPWTRLGHLMIDIACMHIAYAAVVYADAASGLDAVVPLIVSSPPFVTGVVVFSAYYFFLETLFGLTPGKLIMGTRVVDATGRRAGVLRIGLRTAARLIPFDALSFLLPHARGWHDALSDTQVVRKGHRANS